MKKENYLVLDTDGTFRWISADRSHLLEAFHTALDCSCGMFTFLVAMPASSAPSLTVATCWALCSMTTVWIRFSEQNSRLLTLADLPDSWSKSYAVSATMFLVALGPCMH